MNIFHVGVTENGEFGEGFGIFRVPRMIAVQRVPHAVEPHAVDAVIDGTEQGDAEQFGAFGIAFEIRGVFQTLAQALVILFGDPVIELLDDLGVLEQGNFQPGRTGEIARQLVHDDGGFLAFAFCEQAGGFLVLLEKFLGIASGRFSRRAPPGDLRDGKAIALSHWSGHSWERRSAPRQRDKSTAGWFYWYGT